VFKDTKIILVPYKVRLSFLSSSREFLCFDEYWPISLSIHSRVSMLALMLIQYGNSVKHYTLIYCQGFYVSSDAMIIVFLFCLF
jgi:hypothetical protein